MTNYIKNNIKTLIGVFVLVFFIFFLISDEIKHNNAVIDFVREQCKYDSENNTWEFDIKWYLDENFLETRLDPKKSFIGDSGLNECIKYGKELDKDIRNMQD